MNTFLVIVLVIVVVQLETICSRLLNIINELKK